MLAVMALGEELIVQCEIKQITYICSTREVYCCNNRARINEGLVSIVCMFGYRSFEARSVVSFVRWCGINVGKLGCDIDASEC